MSPPFFFRIDEIEEHPDATFHADIRGHWVPSTDPGANRRRTGGISGQYWYCDTQQLRQVAQLPPGCSHYSVFSVYFVAGNGFSVLSGDATNPPPGEAWQPLSFEHSNRDYSSFLTNAGQYATLRIQRTDQEWPRMLLPDIHHTPSRTPYMQYGGLTGELPIFLALIAHSTSREWLPSVLPTVFTGGQWRVHPHQFPRTNERGVVVHVWACPSTYAQGSANELEQYENGNLGKYFN